MHVETSKKPVVKETSAAKKAADFDANSYLDELFNDYASTTTSGSAASSGGIDGAKFLKFCKDAKLIATSSKFRKEDVDIVFAKYKETGQRHLSKSRFSSVLQDIATRKHMSFEELMQYIHNVGPSALGTGTAAIPTRFHDDTSSYTGVYKAGGPTMVDKNHRDLSHLVRPGMK